MVNRSTLIWPRGATFKVSVPQHNRRPRHCPAKIGEIAIGLKTEKEVHFISEIVVRNEMTF